MSIQVEVLTSIEKLDILRDNWAALLTSRDQATPFETLEWTKANLLSFPGQGMRVLVFRDGPEAVGILPLALRSKRKYLRRRTWLEFAGLPFADYGALLVKPGCEAQVAEAFVEYMNSERAFAVAYLDGLRGNDLFSNHLITAAERQGIVATLVRTPEIRRLQRPLRVDNISIALESSKSLGKARKRLSELGEISFDVRTSEDEIQNRLDEYFQMHIDRCAAKGTTSPLAHPEQQKLFRNVVRYCAPAGMVWFSTLSCAGRPVASRFSLRYGDALHLYSTCFAPEFARYSPSMLQLENLLQYAFTNGIRVVDFGMGDSPQKEKAGATAEQQMARVELYGSKAAYWESRLFLGAREKAAKSGWLDKRASTLRRLLPHES